LFSAIEKGKLYCKVQCASSTQQCGTIFGVFRKQTIENIFKIKYFCLSLLQATTYFLDESKN
jgi:hypothetical protein